MRVKHLSKVAQLRSCAVCGKTATSAYNRPHSLHKTKRTVKPNLQPYMGLLICTRCLRTSKKLK
ncbi:MAG TPA: bL28 family ribosomal protein [Patescibacteria group bacterium]|nr:bL28 family ribosomal protein [Patescibacteria group bacterium]